MSALIILVSLLVIGCVVSVLYYFNLLNKEKKGEYENVFVFNPMTQYTKNKSAFGKLKDQHERDGWTGVEFYPRDKNMKKLKKEGKKIEPEIVFVPNNNLEWINKGAWSTDCGFLILLPTKISDVPEAVKNSSFGMGAIIKSAEKENDRFEERWKAVRDKNFEGIVKDVKGLDFVKMRESFLKEGLGGGAEKEGTDKKK